MRRRRGSTAQWVRNLVGSHIPLAPRLGIAARNLRTRLGPPPRGCCGHGGEPGC